MKKFFYIKLYVRRHYCAKIPPYRLLFGPTSIPPPPQIDQIFMGSLLQKSPYLFTLVKLLFRRNF